MSSGKLFKNSTVYAIVQILQKGVGLVLIPFYSNILTPEEKGISEAVLMVVTFFAVFYTLSLNSAVVRYYVDYKDDEKKLKAFWGSCITFILINSFALTLILVVFKDYLLVPFLGTADFYPYCAVGLISITLNPIFVVYQSTLQAREESLTYSKNNFIYFIINLLLNILFVLVLRIGPLGILLALAITDIIFFIHTLFKFVTKLTIGINIKYLKQGLAYSLPLLPHTMSGWALAMVDRLFINNIVGIKALGIYSVAGQFGNVVNVLTTAVNQAYVPWFFNKMKQKEKNEKEIVQISELMIIMYSFFAMGISLFSREIFSILGKFSDGWVLVPFISFTYVFGGLYYFFVNPLFYNKKGVKFIAVGTFSGALLNIVLNLIIVPKFDSMGGAIASLISNILISIFIYFISHKVEKINFNVIKMYMIILMFLIISLIPFLLVDIAMWIGFLIKVIIVLIILAIINFCYQEYTNVAINKIKKLIKKQ